MNPPLSMVGTTATHSADASTSSGMPWSGADSISSSTVLAALIRSSALFWSSSSSLAKVETVRHATTHRSNSFFITDFPDLARDCLQLNTLILTDFVKNGEMGADGRRKKPGRQKKSGLERRP